MPRTIPIALADHIATRSTTMCTLIKITPVQPGFDPFGITTLDRDVVYDDGAGAITYLAAVGTDPSSLTSSADLAVAGGETKQLLAVFDTPISEADLAAGACDYAVFIAYLVNYNDLTSGSHIVLQSGTTGRNTVTDQGLTWTSELRGLTQNLKQSITEKWSLTCRAVFGSTGTSAQSRYPCNFPIDTLWQTGTVTAVGVGNTQQFSAENVASTYGGAPGLVEWLTGPNAGRSDETETFTATGGFSGTGTFTGSGTVEAILIGMPIAVTVTGTGSFDGTGGGKFTGSGTYTGAGVTGACTFFGSGTFSDDGSFVGTGTWAAAITDYVGSGTGTFVGTGTGDTTVTNAVGLTFGAAYAILVGDTFRYRDDCPKTPIACQLRNNYQNYRGEPSIPVSDNGAMSIGNIGGSVTTTTGD